MPGRRGRRRPLLRDDIRYPSGDDDCSSCDAYTVRGNPDPQCTWCKREHSTVLLAPCGHQFCRECVEDIVLPTAACPIDNRFIRETRLAEYVLRATQDSFEDTSSDAGVIKILERRVDALTTVIDRLVEHLAIRDMVNNFHPKHLLNDNISSHHPPIGIREPTKGPVITDSEDSDHTHVPTQEATSDLGAQTKACNLMNALMLCNLPTETIDESGSRTDLVITSTNVRQLLPRFWKRATSENWSDEEKVQRLRMICDPALQRLLDNADVYRRDWAYVSAILYGDHVLDEVSMTRWLGSMRQRQTETPHQWYLRVCDVVERGLPPGPRQEWEVLSTFVRGLHPRYQQALVPGNLPPIPDIIQRCSQLDAKINSALTNGHIERRRTCFSCGAPDHLMRDCPVNKGNVN
ncbi:unnamed protein product [Dicrocoelium dendriticum]|nr:unnamed protein product [Dicrocoelium dendriticum]